MRMSRLRSLLYTALTLLALAATWVIEARIEQLPISVSGLLGLRDSAPALPEIEAAFAKAEAFPVELVGRPLGGLPGEFITIYRQPSGGRIAILDYRAAEAPVTPFVVRRDWFETYQLKQIEVISRSGESTIHRP